MLQELRMAEQQLFGRGHLRSLSKSPTIARACVAPELRC